MQPVKFKESNKVLQKPPGMTDKECGSLPVWNDGTKSISCWQMTWIERLKALLYGRIWLWVYFGPTQPPVALSVESTVFQSEGKSAQ